MLLLLVIGRLHFLFLEFGVTYFLDVDILIGQMDLGSSNILMNFIHLCILWIFVCLCVCVFTNIINFTVPVLSVTRAV